MSLLQGKFSLDEANIQLQRENSELEAELGDAKSRHQAAAERLRQLQKQNKPLQQLQDETVRLDRALEAEKQKQTAYNQKIQGLLAEAAAFDAENGPLNAEIEALTLEIMQIQADADAVEATTAQKQLDIARLGDENMRRETLIQQNIISNDERRAQ